MSSSSSSDEETNVKQKKSGSKKRKLDEDDSPSSSSKKTEQITDSDGNAMHELGNKRYISVSTFKGKTMVNIREYYDKGDGKLLPGKKGISLSQDQYFNLKKHLKKIDEALSG